MVVHPELLDHPLEEVLEQIWYQREAGDETLEGLLRASPDEGTREILQRLAAQHLVEVNEGRVRFLPDGEGKARGVVRRHRLSERLLSDVLDVPLAESDHQACLLEHILSPGVTDRVCAFLGHPPTCPHGLPIPPGPCCEGGREGTLTPVVVRLTDASPGERARIAFIGPRSIRRLERLGTFGVVPGTDIVLRQKRPSYVIEVGGTTLALEGEVAAEIFVRRESR